MRKANFVAGDAVGASDLNLVARNERSWGAQVRVDNQGDDHTGSERVFVDGSWFDPTGHGDAVYVPACSRRAIPRTAITAISVTTRRCRGCARACTRGCRATSSTTATARPNRTARPIRRNSASREVLARSRTRSVALDAGVNYPETAARSRTARRVAERTSRCGSSRRVRRPIVCSTCRVFR